MLHESQSKLLEKLANKKIRERCSVSSSNDYIFPKLNFSIDVVQGANELTRFFKDAIADHNFTDSQDNFSKTVPNLENLRLVF